MINLTGKTAVITGASQGIGNASAVLLAERGANVILCARNKEKIETLANTINKKGFVADALVCDVSVYSDVENVIAFCIKKYGQVDILVNNAGTIDPISLLSESDPEQWSRAIDVNVKGVYYGMRAVLPVMKKQKYGTIINMSSGAATSILEGWSHYCSSKAAAQRLTQVADKETGEDDINIIGLSPGTVATDMMKTIKDSNINPVSQLDWSTHITAETAAKAVLFLCGPEGKEFKGTDFSIKTEEGRMRVGI